MNNREFTRRRIVNDLFDAIEAISAIEGARDAGETHSPKEETELRADVMTAVVELRTELERKREDRDLYDTVLSRWEGEEGYVSKFHDLDLSADSPAPWLRQFANDIHRAGWELGHLDGDARGGLIPRTSVGKSDSKPENDRQVKNFGERTLQERTDGYLQMNIPQLVGDESRLGIEPGEKVSIKAVLSDDESYLKLKGVGDE